VSDWSNPVIRGDLESRSFVAFYLRNGWIEGAVAINRGKDLRRSIALIKSKAIVDPARLADPDTDVRSAVATT
jgi:3-phenylpropionate/trans-cinnamate dioxygenase ferredoxin reductase subunit